MLDLILAALQNSKIPIDLILLFIAGFLVYLAKNWEGSTDGGNFVWVRETIVWGLTLYTLFLLITLLLSPEALKQPNNVVGITSVIFGAAVLLFRPWLPIVITLLEKGYKFDPVIHGSWAFYVIASVIAVIGLPLLGFKTNLLHIPISVLLMLVTERVYSGFLDKERRKFKTMLQQLVITGSIAAIIILFVVVLTVVGDFIF